MLQIVSPKGPFDAIVVGSGATGGWAAKEHGCQNPTLRACEYIIHENAKKTS